MRFAVITPYYQESLSQLTRCHQSILNQNVDVVHFMVSDGYPQNMIDDWDCQHIKLNHHNDYGDTPRGIGAASAATQGFDAICFLDADNWYDPQHLERLKSYFNKYHTSIITVARSLYTVDNCYLGVCKESDGVRFVDTNCYFFHRSIFSLCSSWLFKDVAKSVMGDRVLWKAVIDSGVKRLHLTEPTVNYVTDFAAHYQMFNLTPPLNSRVFSQEKNKFISYSEFLSFP